MNGFRGMGIGALLIRVTAAEWSGAWHPYLTANMTAKTADDCGQWRTTAESRLAGSS
jgi:hypothetical protein